MGKAPKSLFMLNGYAVYEGDIIKDQLQPNINYKVIVERNDDNYNWTNPTGIYGSVVGNYTHDYNQNILWLDEILDCCVVIDENKVSPEYRDILERDKQYRNEELLNQALMRKAEEEIMREFQPRNNSWTIVVMTVHNDQVSHADNFVFRNQDNFANAHEGIITNLTSNKFCRLT